MFKLISIDKTAFDSEWVRNRIRKAMYSGDRQFFKALSKAIAKDPLDTRNNNLELTLVLLFFWHVGLYRLTVPETMQLLHDSGVAFNHDEIAFRKLVDRLQPFVTNR